MVYTLVLGTSALKSVEVRVLSSAHFDKLSKIEFGKVSNKKDEKQGPERSRRESSHPHKLKLISKEA